MTSQTKNVSEEEFHDTWARSANINDIRVSELFESASAPENVWILESMGDLKGLKVLELGAGLGEASVYFALKGAEVTTTDISGEMLNVCQSLAKKHGVKITTVKASATDLSGVPDGYFDIVYAANLLHHVDIESCAKEVKRKLKKLGRGFFWDPVHYNPAIQVYRKMATQVRTIDEHPLKRKDLRTLKNCFGKINTRFFWLTSLVIFFKYFFIDRIHPNQSRYWKKIIEDAPKIGWWLAPLHKVDSLLFRLVPGLKYWAWNVAIQVTNTTNE